MSLPESDLEPDAAPEEVKEPRSVSSDEVPQQVPRGFGIQMRQPNSRKTHSKCATVSSDEVPQQVPRGFQLQRRQPNSRKTRSKGASGSTAQQRFQSTCPADVYNLHGACKTNCKKFMFHAALHFSAKDRVLADQVQGFLESIQLSFNDVHRCFPRISPLSTLTGNPPLEAVNEIIESKLTQTIIILKTEDYIKDNQAKSTGLKIQNLVCGTSVRVIVLVFADHMAENHHGSFRFRPESQSFRQDMAKILSGLDILKQLKHDEIRSKCEKDRRLKLYHSKSFPEFRNQSIAKKMRRKGEAQFTSDVTSTSETCTLSEQCEEGDLGCSTPEYNSDTTAANSLPGTRDRPTDQYIRKRSHTSNNITSSIESDLSFNFQIDKKISNHNRQSRKENINDTSDNLEKGDSSSDSATDERSNMSTAVSETSGQVSSSQLSSHCHQEQTRGSKVSCKPTARVTPMCEQSDEDDVSQTLPKTVATTATSENTLEPGFHSQQLTPRERQEHEEVGIIAPRDGYHDAAVSHMVTLQPAAEPSVITLQPAAEPPVINLQPATEHPVINLLPATEPPVINLQPATEPPVINLLPATEPPVINLQPAAESPVINLQPVAEPPVINLQPATEPPVINLQPAAEPPVINLQPTAEPPVMNDSATSHRTSPCNIPPNKQWTYRRRTRNPLTLLWLRMKSRFHARRSSGTKNRTRCPSYTAICARITKKS